MRAWTLGLPSAYEQAIRMPGNAKQPGGYAFRTRDEAADFAMKYPDEAGRFAPYEMEIPGDDFDAVTAPDGHRRLLTVEAPLINPDTGAPA